MRKFLIISHGRFASGIKSSLELIAGEQENLFAIDAYADGNKAIDSELEDAFARAAPQIPAVKQVIRNISAEKARNLSEQILQMDTAAEIKEYLKAQL